MKGGLTVDFPRPLNNQSEKNVAIMLLHAAHSTPQIVTRKQPLHPADFNFPKNVIKDLHPINKDNNLAHVPTDIFMDIVERCADAELRCEITLNNGRTIKRSAPFLPVLILRDVSDPHFMFYDAPQCHFEEVEVGGQKEMQLLADGPMRDFLRDILHEEGYL